MKIQRILEEKKGEKKKRVSLSMFLKGIQSSPILELFFAIVG